MQDSRTGWLQLDGWAGRSQQEVQVVGETRKRLRIRAITRTRLAGRLRSLNPGEEALVPIHAVRDSKVEGVEVVT